MPAVEATRQSGGRPGAGSRTAERASIALSVSRTAAGGAEPGLSPKPPRAGRGAGGRARTGPQREAAAVAAGAGGEAFEGGAVGARAGADEFGASGGAVAVAAGEDGVAAAVGVERAGLAAAFEQGRVEAAGVGQEVAHGWPVFGDGAGQAQDADAGGGKRGGRDRRRTVGEEGEGLAEPTAAGMHDEVDRAAAALAAGVIEELGAADAEHRAVPPPALATARVALVAEPLGERLQGSVADAVGVLAVEFRSVPIADSQIIPAAGGQNFPDYL